MESVRRGQICSINFVPLSNFFMGAVWSPLLTEKFRSLWWDLSYTEVASEGGKLGSDWGDSDLYGGSNGRSTPREIIGVCSDDGTESSTEEVEDVLKSGW